MIDIKFCEADDVKKLQLFINEHWKENHILAIDENLLRWQHFDVQTNRYNFVAGFDNSTGEIAGILGFIPVNQYDSDSPSNKDIWLAIWKIKDGYTGLGLELLNFLIDFYKPDTIGSIGINKKVKRLYKALNFSTGFLEQYYLLNPEIKDFKIAKVTGQSIELINEKSECKIVKLDSLSGLNIKLCYKPYKSIEYLENRYLRHPYYKYSFFAVLLENEIKFVFVARKVVVSDSSCLRIVDVLGDLSSVGSIKSELIDLLIGEKCEFIDCLNYGIDSLVFENLGFSRINSDIVIPNYFEPFLQENILIEFAYLSKHDVYTIFKGDSDQDRPSLVI